MAEYISSRKNPLVAELRKLNSKSKARREKGVFLADGEKMLQEAIRWNAPISLVLTTQGKQIGKLPDSCKHVEVPSDLMDYISNMEAPQGVLFQSTIPDTSLPEVLPKGKYLVLDGLQDPGNIGTIWRTADALSADGLIFVNHCSDPFNPKTIRATMGAVFRQSIWECSPEELKSCLDRSEIPLLATALRDDTVDIRDEDLSCAAVVIGNEGRGISDEMLSLCRKTIKIPMRSRCESLNAAIAASIVLWEMSRESI